MDFWPIDGDKKIVFLHYPFLFIPIEQVNLPAIACLVASLFKAGGLISCLLFQ